MIQKYYYLKGSLHPPAKCWNKGCEMLFFNVELENVIMKRE